MNGAEKEDIVGRCVECLQFDCCCDDLGDDCCPACGDSDEPDSWQSACIDDMCHGGEVPCMHGDYSRLKCSFCGR